MVSLFFLNHPYWIPDVQALWDKVCVWQVPGVLPFICVLLLPNPGWRVVGDCTAPHFGVTNFEDCTLHAWWPHALEATNVGDCTVLHFGAIYILC